MSFGIGCSGLRGFGRLRRHCSSPAMPVKAVLSRRRQRMKEYFMSAVMPTRGDAELLLAYWASFANITAWIGFAPKATIFTLRPITHR
jgi:hypothetical protein